jgi:hypothetical protein
MIAAPLRDNPTKWRVSAIEATGDLGEEPTDRRLR